MLFIITTAVGFYLFLSYSLLPFMWTHYEHQPSLAEHSMVTYTSQEIAGDPLNVGLIGDLDDVIFAMKAAGWLPADAITWHSSLKIIGSIMLDHPYHNAPISDLYYQGRREDLAFEKPAGKNARKRHHVRLWLILKNGVEGRPVWLGAATFDAGLGFNHYTGQFTHYIAPDIDFERNLLVKDLAMAGTAEVIYHVSGVGPTFNGRNGGGHLYQTDGDIHIVRLMPDGNWRPDPPLMLKVPFLIQIKNMIWQTINQSLSESKQQPENLEKEETQELAP